MRIRDLLLHDFRHFQGARRISFVDAATGAVRPVTALVGPDEAAKATVLEAIEALLSYAVEPHRPRPLIDEAMQGGLLRLELELTRSDLALLFPDASLAERHAGRVLRIEVGRRGVAPLLPVQEWSRFLACLASPDTREPLFTNAGALSSLLLTAVARMQRGADLHGGLLYFPAVSDAAAPATAGQRERSWIDQPLAALSGPAGEAAAWPAIEGAAGACMDLAASEDTQALPIFGALAARRRPGAVIAVDDPALATQAMRRGRTVERLRRLAQDWDAQLIVAVRSDEFLDAFAPEERVVLA